ncbi:MAG: hypothetical protein O3A20_08630 [Planctomycetota bacterium]|nr:hypothetical protein [Planctomycetota bacterium]
MLRRLPVPRGELPEDAVRSRRCVMAGRGARLAPDARVLRVLPQSTAGIGAQRHRCEHGVESSTLLHPMTLPPSSAAEPRLLKIAAGC